MNSVEWRDYSVDTSFPFLDGNNISVPIIDARIVADSHPYLSRVLVDGFGVSLYFANKLGTEISHGRISSVDESDIVELEFLSGGNAGIVIVDRSRDSEWSNSEYEWSESALVPSCFDLLDQSRLNALVLNSLRVSGRVAIVEGSGIKFVVSGSKIRIDAIADTSERERCCQQVGGPIKMINDATPDDYGNINLILQPYLEPDKHSDQIQILRMLPIQDGITFYIAK